MNQIRLKTAGVYGQEYNSVLYHHPPRGVVADSEEFGELIKLWEKNPTEETYKTILQKAKDTNEWWR